MFVYRVEMISCQILDESTKDRIQSMCSDAPVYATLESAKKAAEEWAQEEVDAVNEDRDEDDEVMKLPTITWEEDKDTFGDYQLDPWDVRKDDIYDWSPGWWVIMKVEVRE